jgi:hypothetical protein
MTTFLPELQHILDPASVTDSPLLGPVRQLVDDLNRMPFARASLERVSTTRWGVRVSCVRRNQPQTLLVFRVERRASAEELSLGDKSAATVSEVEAIIRDAIDTAEFHDTLLALQADNQGPFYGILWGADGAHVQVDVPTPEQDKLARAEASSRLSLIVTPLSPWPTGATLRRLESSGFSLDLENVTPQSGSALLEGVKKS